MQPVTNYQMVMVSTTMLKRIIKHGAVCSKCGMGVNIHGTHRRPCDGGFALLTQDVLDDFAKS